MARVHVSLVDDMVKLDVHSGSLPHSIDSNLILQIDTDINNKDEFYTDSNGLRLVKRKIKHVDPNFAGFWNDPTMSGGHFMNVTENYYPVSSEIKINDTEKSLQVFNDRA